MKFKEKLEEDTNLILTTDFINPDDENL